MFFVAATVIWSGSVAHAQAPAPVSGRQLFDQTCTACHGNTDVPRAADPAVLRRMTPELIYQALTTGVMRPQAEGLSGEGRRAIAEYLGDRKLGTGAPRDAGAMPNRCAAGGPTGNQGAAPAWNGWGVDAMNTRFQPAEGAGLTAAAVSRLRLKWAFGVPGASSVYGQPTVSGGRVFVGADTGYVYALDAASGCVHWSFQAQAGVRSAVVVGSAAGRAAAFFGDMKGAVYGVDAANGALIWRAVADDHALARITAAPALHRDRVYVSVSSGEEGASTSARYPCCTFRGSIVALRVDTGQQVWKTFTIADAPQPTRRSATGTQQFGPSGAGVWNTPTIDVRRNALYVGTGNAYSRPAAETTDAVVAFNLDSGAIVWTAQAVEGDAWIPGCGPTAPAAANCPEPLGPDYDFGASPILVARPDGRRMLISPQKSGIVWAHDPDRQGAVVWKAPLAGAQPAADGEMVWGGATDGERVYVGLNTGGVTALNVATGSRAWTARIEAAEGRRQGHSGAVSAIPGIVFSGGWDGVLRALAADSGRIVWQFDTVREFDTVNRVPARGGSMGAAGPTIAGGMVFVGSGYIGVRSGTVGNVLLAFAAD
jgi:polyvinyl alcohol dehydrogenase (cytochrome)